MYWGINLKSLSKCFFIPVIIGYCGIEIPPAGQTRLNGCTANICVHPQFDKVAVEKCNVKCYRRIKHNMHILAAAYVRLYSFELIFTCEHNACNLYMN